MALSFSPAGGDDVTVTLQPSPLWRVDNLVPMFAPVGTESFQREFAPRSRARLLRERGFRHTAVQWAGTQPFLHWWRHAPIPTLDEELDALSEADIDLFAVWFPFDPGDAQAEEYLAAFRRHGVTPRLWVMQSMRNLPTTAEGWDELMTGDDVFLRINGVTFENSPEEHEARLTAEADRIRGLARMGAEYGCEVSLYNHHGWSGLTGNLVTIIERLAAEKEPPVSLVYTFSHARDAYHDDSADFSAIWSRIRPHVDAINIGGTANEGRATHVGELDRELEMMRIVQESGWTGPVAIKMVHGSRESLEDSVATSLRGIEWCSRELERPGSGGPRPS